MQHLHQECSSQCSADVDVEEGEVPEDGELPEEASQHSKRGRFEHDSHHKPFRYPVSIVALRWTLWSVNMQCCSPCVQAAASSKSVDAQQPPGRHRNIVRPVPASDVVACPGGRRVDS